jgi:catechol 2,3-dioxygenase-like lactoylglutathione lyase family enzyme
MFLAFYTIKRNKEPLTMTDQKPSLNAVNAVANIAVKDIDAARKFYGESLGLKEISHIDSQMIVYQSGESMIYVYRSDFAGTNQATAMTWSVGDDVQSLVNELKAKGIRFEHYDLPETKHEGDLHVSHGMKVAWFKDPDGNILNIAGGRPYDSQLPSGDAAMLKFS